MGGTKTTIIRLQDRDRRLLEELDLIRVMSRDQAKLIGGFSSLRRTNDRLLHLTRAGILKAILLTRGEANAYMRAGTMLPKTPGDPPTLFVQHQLSIGAIYLLLKYCLLPSGFVLRRWLRFDQPLSKTVGLIPDGYCELESASGVIPMFLEIDMGTEGLAVWQKKCQMYLQFALSGEFPRIFGQEQFRVLVIAPSDKRARNIQALAARVTEKIFWFSTFPNINREGFWSPVWLRPTSNQLISLF